MMYWIFLIGLYNAQFSGTATYSNDTTVSGKCSFPPSKGFWGAVGPESFQNSTTCGSCAKVKSNKKQVIVHIIDECQSCDVGDLSISQSAFSKLDDLDLGRIPVKWEYVPCPNIKGPIQFYWQPGSTFSYMAFQIRNHIHPIAKVAYRQSKKQKWKRVHRREDNFFILSKVYGPFQVKITSKDGQTIINDDIEPVREGGFIIGQGQFEEKLDEKYKFKKTKML